MAKKIIMFVSDYKEGATRENYLCPDGETWVDGAQTNEAPVKYLLRENPGISEIIGIVTEAAVDTWDYLQDVLAEKDPRESDLAEVSLNDVTSDLGMFYADAGAEPLPKRRLAECTAWLAASYAEAEEQPEPAASGGPSFRKVEYDETKGEVFRDLIPKILERVQEGDEIFWETTGGFRNATMYLLLLSRILSYCGIATSGAVYSVRDAKNHGKNNKIEDLSQLIGLFDLVGGMQELTNQGDVRTLIKYYDSPNAQTEMQEVVSAMGSLNDSITLCRIGDLEQKIDDFNAAVAAAEATPDQLQRLLLGKFKAAYGGDKLDTEQYIRWFLKNDMIQQALTVYTEHIVRYIVAKGNLFTLAKTGKDKNLKDSYATKFNEEFLQDGFSTYCYNILYARLEKAVKTGQFEPKAAKIAGYQTPKKLKAAVDNLQLLLANMFAPAAWYDPEENYDLPDFLEPLAARLRAEGAVDDAPAILAKLGGGAIPDEEVKLLFGGAECEAEAAEKLKAHITGQILPLAKMAAQLREALPQEDAKYALALHNVFWLMCVMFDEKGNYKENWPEDLPKGKKYLSEIKLLLTDKTPTRADMGSLRTISSRVGMGKLYLQLLFDPRLKGVIRQSPKVRQQAEQAGEKLPKNYKASDKSRVLLVENLPAVKDWLYNKQQNNVKSYLININDDKLDVFAAFCLDYMYIKMLRNLTNHANDSEQDNQKFLVDYLAKYGYPAPAEISKEKIRDIMNRSLDRLM